MPEEYRNIYKSARKARGYTQESAAERLGISVESLRAYETDQRVPPTEVVELMVICYDAQYLAHQHLRETNAMYGKVVPPVPQVGVLEASARLTNRIYAFADSHADRRLMRITEDNVIDGTERAEFDAILEDLQEIVSAALALRCAQQADGQPSVRGITHIQWMKKEGG